MTTSGRSWSWKLGLASWLLISGALALGGGLSPIASLENSALAQITPDTTLGSENSVLNPDQPVDVIFGGAQRGANLFHSFQEFNVGEGRGAYFYSPSADIQNVLARVTGSNRSEILGTIGTFGNSNPNLFLINPNGVIFGPNASLDMGNAGLDNPRLGGSFVATTANAVLLGDRGIFSASNPATSKLLTVNPSALFFNAIARAEIVNQSTATNSVLGYSINGLQVPNGRSLLLVGGDVTIDRGKITASGGRVELGGVVGSGAIGLSMDGNDLNLSFPNSVAKADVSLTNGTEVNVRASSGGSIAINAQDLSIVAGSGLLAGIDFGLGSAETQAGDIEINATGKISLSNKSFINNELRFGSQGNGGNINITTRSLFVTNGSQLSTSNAIAQGNAGSINITARDSISFEGIAFPSESDRELIPLVASPGKPSRVVSNAISQVSAGGIGDGGNINITTGSLFVTNGAGLVASTQGQGKAGSINVTARNLVYFAGEDPYGLSSNAASRVEETGVGEAGGINITADQLSVTDGALLTVSTDGQGNGGNVIINARDRISFDGSGRDGVPSGAYSRVLLDAQGQGGNITINNEAGLLSVTNGAQLSTSTFAQREGGNIFLNAKTLEVVNGGQILTTSLSSGKAGNITANVTDSVTLAGSDPTYLKRMELASASGNNFSGAGSTSGLFTNTSATSTGQGGNLRIATKQLNVLDGAQASVSSEGTRNAGNLEIASRRLQLDKGTHVSLEGSAVFSTLEESGAVGNGGDINITAGSLSLTDGAQLVANTFGQGDGGSVNINVRDMVFLRNLSQVFSTLGSGAVGNGGDINITAGSLSLTDGAQLVASTFGKGHAGSVNINVSDRVSFNGVGSNGSNTTASSTVGAEAIGNGGGINIKANSLSVTNGAYLIGSTQEKGQGNAGSVNINVSDRVLFNGVGSDGFPSAALSAVEFQSIGNGGDINITTGSLSVSNGAYLSASTFGQGDAGSVNINARDVVSFNGAGSNGLPSAAFSTVEDTAVGNGIGIDITAKSLFLTNGAYLSASTRGQGNGGNIRLNVDTLEAVNGGQVLTSSRSNGKAGNINVDATDSVTLSGSDPTYYARIAQSNEEVRVFEVFGRKLAIREQVAADAGPVSGLFASTFENSTGQGGGLKVSTGQMVIQDGAQVSVSSEGAGNAGNLEIASRKLELDRGALRASTTSGEGGNINLQVRDLILMRHNSLISAEAGGTGNGGNIRINTPFIIAVPNENSDIFANAIRGNGGNINIKASGIFGLKYRDRPTDQTNDINASSAFGVDGAVEIDTPDIAPSQGLSELPVQPIGTEVVQACQPGSSQASSEFVVTGRGGLPPTPIEALSSDAVQVDWVTLNPKAENTSSQTTATNPTNPTPAPIVEAQGWVINQNGNVVLTASAVPVLSPNPWQNSAQCHASQSETKR